MGGTGGFSEFTQVPKDWHQLFIFRYERKRLVVLSHPPAALLPSWRIASPSVWVQPLGFQNLNVSKESMDQTSLSI